MGPHGNFRVVCSKIHIRRAPGHQLPRDRFSNRPFGAKRSEARSGLVLSPAMWPFASLVRERPDVFDRIGPPASRPLSPR
jgi:hypothetical protein